MPRLQPLAVAAVGATAVVLLLLTMPSTVEAFAASPSKAGAAPDPPTAGAVENAFQSYQIWALRHPFLATIPNFFLWPFVLKQSTDGNYRTWIDRKRRIYGSNFVASQAVWIADFAQVEKALLEPQARSFRLGSTFLSSPRLPCKSVAGGGSDFTSRRNNFLLSLSNREVGGNGDWDGFRAAVDDFMTSSPETMARQRDATCEALLDRCCASYKELGHTAAFFEDSDKGLTDFLLRYLHYVVLGLDPFDDETMDVLRKLHFDSASPLFHFATLGPLVQLLKFRDWPQQFRQVAAIYEQAPDVQKFPNDKPAKYAQMTRKELAALMVSMMAIAGMPGPSTLAPPVFGWEALDAEGKDSRVEPVDLTKVWDDLDLSDRRELIQYVCEVGRLRSPVSASHRVVASGETFRVEINGRDLTFPSGTPIVICLYGGQIDESVWGPSVWKFDHRREGGMEKSLMFHSVGQRSNGRFCPARDLATIMMCDLLERLGKVRRSPDFQPQGAAAPAATA